MLPAFWRALAVQLWQDRGRECRGLYKKKHFSLNTQYLRQPQPLGGLSRGKGYPSESWELLPPTMTESIKKAFDFRCGGAFSLPSDHTLVYLGAGFQIRIRCFCLDPDPVFKFLWSGSDFNTRILCKKRLQKVLFTWLMTVKK